MRSFLIVVVIFLGALMLRPEPSTAADCTSKSAYLYAARAAISKLDSISYDNFEVRSRLFGNALAALKGASNEADNFGQQYPRSQRTLFAFAEVGQSSPVGSVSFSRR